MKIDIENIKKGAWNFTVLGDMSKQNIRDLVSEAYPHEIFGTASGDWIKVSKKNVKLKILLDNASSEDINDANGWNLADKISLKSGGKFKFVKHISDTYDEDLHGYEPSKIAPGTMAEITDWYVILKAAHDNYKMEFEPIVEIKLYSDGGPNDRGERQGYMEVTEDMFDIGKMFGEPALVQNEEFNKAYAAKFGSDWHNFLSWYFVSKKKYKETLVDIENQLKSYKL